MTKAGQVSDLKGLGPKSQEMLARAGVKTIAQLRRLGSVAAYVRAKRANPETSLNLLWGLESALTGIPWKEVARIYRASLLLAVEEHEKNTFRRRSAPAPEIEDFNQAQADEDRRICERLAATINAFLTEAECRIWHRHPVWFLAGNPTVGYSKLKSGIRLMFWSGADFGESGLAPGTGKFKDASVTYRSVSEVSEADLKRWLRKSREIQWDYRNIYRTRGKLNRLK